MTTAGMALCNLLGHLGSLSGQGDGPRPLLVFKPIAGSILTAWPWASHSTFQGLSVVIFIIDKIIEETLALFTDFSEQLDLSMKDWAVPLGTEFPTAGHLQADWHIQASTLRGML